MGRSRHRGLRRGRGSQLAAVGSRSANSVRSQASTRPNTYPDGADAPAVKGPYVSSARGSFGALLPVNGVASRSARPRDSHRDESPPALLGPVRAVREWDLLEPQLSLYDASAGATYPVAVR